MNTPHIDQINSPKKLRDYLHSVGAVGLMNHTKWNRLYENIIPLYGKVEIRRKDLDECEPYKWDRDLYYKMGHLQHVEWIELRAYNEFSNGALLDPTITYYTDELVQAVSNSSVRYELISEHVLKIVGYIFPHEGNTLK